MTTTVRLFWFHLWRYRLDVFEKLNESLRTLGYDFEVVNSAAGDVTSPPSTYAFPQGIVFGKYFFGYALEFAPGLRQFGDIRKVDVFIYEWNSRNVGMLIVTILRRYLFNKPTVWWGHGVPKHEKFFLTPVHYWMARTLPDHIIVYGQREKEELERKGVPAANISVAPNGLNLTEIDSHVAQYGDDYRPRDDKFRIIYSGRLPDFRGLDTVFDAMDILEKEQIEIEFIIVGDGPAREQLGRLVVDRYSYCSVTFMGSVYDPQILAEIYRDVRVAVIPGWLGLTLTQASAFRRASIISDNDRLHNPEVQQFLQGKTGWKYEYGDAQKLATLLLNTLSMDVDDVSQFGIRAYEVVHQKYNTDTMAQKITGVVASAVESQAARE